jgi:hypothetical protein
MAAIGLAAGTASCLAGCAGIHLSDWQSSPSKVSADTPASESMTPGAVTASTAPSGSLGFAASDRGDWDMIRSTVITSLASPPTAHIEWSNPTTGDSGTISDLATLPKPRDCRSFSTTIAGVDGVRLYHAEICRGIMNTWEFSMVAAADGSLSAKAPL